MNRIRSCRVCVDRMCRYTHNTTHRDDNTQIHITKSRFSLNTHNYTRSEKVMLKCLYIYSLYGTYSQSFTRHLHLKITHLQFVPTILCNYHHPLNNSMKSFLFIVSLRCALCYRGQFSKHIHILHRKPLLGGVFKCFCCSRVYVE